jgi:5-deoxy-glucuronate isomerase
MSTTDQRWFHRQGARARDGWESVVDVSTPGWEHTGIRIAVLTAETSLSLDEVGIERLVVPLSGAFSVAATEDDSAVITALHGRASVFDGPTDVLYLSAAATAIITGEGRVAIATSPTAVVKPSRHIAAADIPVELRGAGASSRQVHNFGTLPLLDAAGLIVCEVITPADNWSSYPPHKHDQHVPGRESRLEEIYYFESAPARGSVATTPHAAFGLFSAYSSPAGEIDINAMVRTGDIALVPFGYHGPAVAAPGYDLYYLNVMAGPDPGREWLISDDPDHAWVRETWDNLAVDPRLPYAPDKEGHQ